MPVLASRDSPPSTATSIDDLVNMCIDKKVLFSHPAEISGRWHPSVPQLVQRLAKDATSRHGRDDETFAALLTRRWSARLSALLIRGNGVVLLLRVANMPHRRGLGAA